MIFKQLVCFLSICTDFQQQCAPFIAQFPQLTPNCSTIATRVPDGFEDWPNDTIVFQNDTSGPFPVILTTQCNAWSAAEAALIRVSIHSSHLLLYFHLKHNFVNLRSAIYELLTSISTLFTNPCFILFSALFSAECAMS